MSPLQIRAEYHRIRIAELNNRIDRLALELAQMNSITNKTDEDRIRIDYLNNRIDLQKIRIIEETEDYNRGA